MLKAIFHSKDPSQVQSGPVVYMTKQHPKAGFGLAFLQLVTASQLLIS